MFLSCGGGIIGGGSSGGGGGGGTIINNYYYYTLGHPSSINWINGANSPELAVSGPAYSIVDASQPPYNANGSALQVSSAGTVTLTFYMDITFQEAVVYNNQGVVITFYNSAGMVVQTGMFTGSGTSTYSMPVTCRSITFQMTASDAIGPVVWTTTDPVAVLRAASYAAGTENFAILSTNAQSNGTTFVPIAAGNMIFYFPPTTTIYRIDYTGTIYAYSDPTTLVFTAESNSVIGAVFDYAERVFMIQCTGTVTLILYRQFPLVVPEVLKTENFTEFAALSANAETADLSCVGQVINNATVGKNVLQAYGGALSVTFRDLATVSTLVLVEGSGGTITVTGPFNFVLNVPVGATTVLNITNQFQCTEMVFTAGILISEIIYSISAAQAEEFVPAATTYTFAQFATGEININTPQYTISSANMVDFPSMILNSNTTTIPQFANNIGNCVCYSSDANPNAPNPGTGTLNVVFVVPVYLQSMEFLTATGTVVVSGKTYQISNQGNNSVQTINFRDFVNQGSLLCNSAQINFNGCLVNMVFTLAEPLTIITPPNGSVYANYQVTSPVSIPVPEYAISGSTVTFKSSIAAQTDAYYINTILVTMSALGGQLKIYKSGNLLLTIYVPFYGNGDSYTAQVNMVADEIIETGGLTYVSFLYWVPQFRQMIGLLDNSNTAVNIATANSGNYQFSAQSMNANGANSLIQISKGNPAAGPASFAQKSAGLNGESVDVLWPVNAPAQIYHYTTVSGGVGATIYYAVVFTAGI